MLEFCKRIESEYKAGVAHMFLLHFNVDDLAKDEVYGYLPMMDYLMEQLNVMGSDLVIGYSPSRGVIWPNTSEWSNTQQLLGLRHGIEWADEEFVGEEPPIGTLDENGVFIPQREGIGQIRAAVGEVSAEPSTINVDVEKVDRIAISPETATVSAGKRRKFSAVGHTPDGQEIVLSRVRWRVIGGIGAIDNSGVFTAKKVGSGKVQARFKDTTGESGEITVVPGSLAKVSIEPDEEVILTPGEKKQFKVVGRDANGNVIEPESVEWQVVGRETPVKRRKINSNVIHWKLHEDPLFQEKSPAKIRPKLEELLRVDRLKVGIVIDYIDEIAPNTPSPTNDEVMFIETVQQWAKNLEIRARQHIVLLLTRNIAKVAPALALNNEIPDIEVPFPNYSGRLQLIEHLLNLPIEDKPSHRTQFVTRLKLEDGMSKEELAELTAGLNLYGIHDAALKAEEMKQPISREIVEEYKRRSIRIHSRDVLDVMTVEHGIEEVGGLKHVERYLREVVNGLRDQDPNRVPMGLLFLGPPGTGKTFAAQALAKESGMAFVQLKNAREAVSRANVVSDVEERLYVQNLSYALNFIKALTPAIVFIDDADQAIAPRGEFEYERVDSMMPVELLNTMSDSSLRGKILWIGASNRPDFLDPAFRKRGIFDDKLVFLQPTAAEREEILQKLFVKHRINIEKIDFSKVASDEYTKGFSGGDLDIVVTRSYRVTRAQGRNVVSEDDLLAAISDFVPEYAPETYEFMSLLAIREANSKFMLPSPLPAKYEKFIEKGKINKSKINKRLRELEDILEF